MTNRPLKILLASSLLFTGLSLPAFADSSEDASVNRWVRKVEWKVDRYMDYPTRAAMAEHQGLVQMRVKLTPEGDIHSAQIIGSSGSEHLDKAALKLAKRMDDVPTPPMIDGKQVKSVRFHLLYALAPSHGRLTAREQSLRRALGRIEIKDIQAQSNNGRIAMFLETEDDVSKTQ